MDDDQTQPGQRVSDLEVEMARTMLRIAADVDHLDQLTERSRSTRLGASNKLVETAGDLRAQVEQAARFSQCAVLGRLVQEHRSS